jgi:hypothetical protein
MGARAGEMGEIVGMSLMAESRRIETLLLDRIGDDRCYLFAHRQSRRFIDGSDYRCGISVLDAAGCGMVLEGTVQNRQRATKYLGSRLRRGDLCHADGGPRRPRARLYIVRITDKKETAARIGFQRIPGLGGDFGSDACGLTRGQRDRPGAVHCE